MSINRSSILAALAVGVAGLAGTAGPSGAAFDGLHDTTCETVDSGVGAGTSVQRSLHLGFGATIGLREPAAPLRQGFGYDVAGCAAFKLASDGGTESMTYRSLDTPSGAAAMGAINVADGRHLDAAGSPIAPVNFAGVDDAPTTAQLANANEGHLDDSVYNDDATLHTIPIAQSAVAVVARIPDGCSVVEGGDTDERQISRVAADGAFAADARFDTWGEVLTGITGRVSATGGSCATARLVRVVRLGASGTTSKLKRHLFAVNNTRDADTVTAGTQTWGSAGNLVWPNDGGATAVVRSSLNHSGALLDTLSAQSTTGGIGYADLASARGREYGWGSSTNDPNDVRFWIYVQRIADNNYRSPALSNAQSTATKGANCARVRYADSITGALPAGTLASWSDVDAVSTTTDYAICGLTYALVWETPQPVNRGINRNAASNAPLSQSQQRATKDYFAYITSSTAQSKLNGLDYGPLPSVVGSNVLGLSLTGVASLTW